MKHTLSIAMLLLTATSFSQNRNTDFSSIDYRVQFVEAASPSVLSKLLTTSCKNDLEKTRAIFRWITEHISYLTKEMKNSKNRQNKMNSSNDDEDTLALKPLNERVADIVLQRKSGLCDGYARLFKTLCDYAGIPCEIINGYARNDMDQPNAKFGSNHSWNAVLIDSSWHLLDVTWATGFISKSKNEFVKSFNEQYFLTEPEDFIRDHYPDDLKWTLLPSPPVPGEFKRSPYKQKSFTKYKIISYSPGSGIINAAMGDTVHIELQTSNYEYDHHIVPDLLIDSTFYFLPVTRIFLNPSVSSEYSPQGTKLEYTYIVNSPAAEWLFIKYNDDVILRYKLRIRRPDNYISPSN